MRLADLLGVATEIEFEGKKLAIRPPSQVEQGRFSRWLEQRAREFVARSNDLDDADKDRLLRGIAADSAAGIYDWGSDAYVRALSTPLGIAKMLQFVLRTENPAVLLDDEFTTRLVAQRVAEIAAVLAAQETDDPKAQAAILTAVGLPHNFLQNEPERSNSGSTPPPSTHPSEPPATSKPSDE